MKHLYFHAKTFTPLDLLEFKYKLASTLHNMHLAVSQISSCNDNYFMRYYFITFDEIAMYFLYFFTSSHLHTHISHLHF